jgi:hypothetical protein
VEQLDRQAELTKTVLDAALNLRRPLQLAAFALAIALLLGWIGRPIQTSVLVLFALVLPVLVSLLVLDEKRLRAMMRVRGPTLLFLFLLIVVAFSLPTYCLILMVRNGESGKSIQDLQGKALSDPYVRRVADDVVRSKAKLATLITGVQQLDGAFDDASSGGGLNDLESVELLKSVYNAKQELISKICETRRDSAQAVFGNGEVSTLLEGMQQGLYSLKNAAQIEQLLDHIYEGDGRNRIKASDLLSADDPSFSKDDRKLMAHVELSETEQKLLHAIGSQYLGRSINSLSETDIHSIRMAFANLEWSDASQSAKSDGDMLRDFRIALNKYLSAKDQSLRFMDLATHGRQSQFKVYLAIYDAGAISFERMVVALTPKDGRALMRDILRQPIHIPSASEFSRLAKLLAAKASVDQQGLEAIDPILRSIAQTVEAHGNELVADVTTMEGLVVRELQNALGGRLALESMGLEGFHEIEEFDYGAQIRSVLQYYELMEMTSLVRAL